MHDLEQICEEVRNELTPYGQYIICQGSSEGTQFFGIAELVGPALIAVGWAVKEIVQALIREMIKRILDSKANEKIRKLEVLVEDLNRQISTLSIDVKQTEQVLDQVVRFCRHMEIEREFLVSFEIDVKALAALLQRFGLTPRSASHCVEALMPIMNIHLREALIRRADETLDDRGKR